VVKQYFLFGAALLIPLMFVSWFLFLLCKSLYGMFQDWRLNRELDQLQSEASGRREALAESNRVRLDNGCEHDFDTGAHGMPPETCRTCGLERAKPLGTCDHVWVINPGPVPVSACKKCGRKYSITEQMA
jgi:hypothetical protein